MLKLSKNIITDSLDNTSIKLASIDVDMYEAVLAALHKVTPRIVQGGVILVEDPQHTPYLIGARVAFEEFMQTDIAKDFNRFFLFGGQEMLIRTNARNGNHSSFNTLVPCNT